MSGRYKAYGEYKESGVEWLGEIPGNWGYISISRMFTRIKRTGHIERELLSVYRDYGVIPKSSRDDNNNMPSEDLSPYQLVEINDLVMNKMKAWQGSIAISECEGIVSPAYFVYSPKLIFNDLALPKYIHYLLRNSIYITQYLSRSKGIRVNQWDLDPDEFKSIDVLLPTKEEQFQIAAFLDHETAKIDTLIDKQQQLIELLKEKRQAVISHAVTKGLDPDVPMKDSGVEWLGEVPENWIVSRIGYYASKIGSGKTPKGGAEIYQSSGILFLRSQNIYDDGLRISDSDNAYISEVINEEMNNTKVKVGDVLLNITGGSIGRSCIVTNELIEANVNQHVCILRFADLYREFISLFMKSKSFKKQIDISQTGGNREGLNFWQISKFIFCVPIYSDINAIVEFIKGKIILFNELEEKSILAIELLKERRTALISAAVTGKIDVRDWQVPVTQTESDEVMA